MFSKFRHQLSCLGRAIEDKLQHKGDLLVPEVEMKKIQSDLRPLSYTAESQSACESIIREHNIMMW
jgi:hypothetical protein